jgi:hypothetical protein
MNTIYLRGLITPERRLIVELPPDAPTGIVELALWVTDAANEGRLPHEVDDIAHREIPVNEERDRIRALLAAAGLLATVKGPPAWFVPTEEDEMPIELPPGSPTIQQMINDERGER